MKFLKHGRVAVCQIFIIHTMIMLLVNIVYRSVGSTSLRNAVTQLVVRSLWCAECAINQQLDDLESYSFSLCDWITLSNLHLRTTWSRVDFM